MSAALELRFAYTLADLDAMTRAALVADRSGALPFPERRDVAWSAIAEALYAAPHAAAASRARLIRAGWQAIYAEVRDGRRHAGYRDREADAGVGSSPRFAQFWYRPPVAFEEHLVERIATRQILASLRAPYREAVLALAACGDRRAAAAALGITPAALTQRLVMARREFTAAWLQGETPRRDGRGNHPDTCRRGHARVEHGYRDARGGWVCRACRRLRDASAVRRHGWTRRPHTDA